MLRSGWRFVRNGQGPLIGLMPWMACLEKRVKALGNGAVEARFSQLHSAFLLFMRSVGAAAWIKES